MSTRRDRHKKELAAQASARFAELQELMTERAGLAVCGPPMVADLAGRVPAASLARLEGWIAGRLAELDELIRGYRGDERLNAIVAAELVLSDAERSTE
jgi:hypothetical protein